MALGDDIGSRGEAIFVVLITRFCGRERPLFRPYFLGEKAESIDFLVELMGVDALIPFCFVQVRTTRRGYTGARNGSRRLRVQVSAGDAARLARFPAPVYVVGIDEQAEAGYIVHAGALTGGISSLPTDYALDCASLEMLWNEVKEYWEANAIAVRASVFGYQERTRE
jgi:hypothetical protein